MLKQFAQNVEDMRRLIVGSASSRFLLAVSGGMDSMCMADLFLQVLGAESFAVAHCNFSLRGAESDGDEALVCEWTQAHGVQLFVKRFDTISYARENGVSIEMAARELRYGWFAQLCGGHGFAALSVAHNANDNAETLMLNLLRGTGLAGLHGIARVSEMSSVVICRPLLEFTRKQIEGYVLAHRVPYRHDSSNFESDYKRNRIRNEVFPIFEKINPSFVRTINREIGYFAEAGSIVEDWCRSQLSDVLFSHPQGAPEISATPLSHDRSDRKPVTISISRLLAREHWKYLLYYILEPYGFNSQTLASVESLLASDRTVSGKRFESADYVLITTSDTLRVVSKEDAPVENGDHIMVVRGEGVYNFNGCRFKVEVLDWSPEMPLKQPAGTLVLDADMLGFPFVCRRWRQGDWMVPFGMKGKKKVSDIFTDLKFDVLQKDSSVIVVDTRTPDLAEQQHVAALLGLRMDDRYKVTHSTREILRITLL